MQLIIGSVMMESNTFSPLKADLQCFKNGYLLFGDEIIDYHKDKQTEIGGFIQVGRSEKVKLFPVLAAWGGMASGKVTRECFEFLKERLIQGIKKCNRIDGVLLALHGAMVAENIDDPEGDLLKTIKTVVGEKVPVACTLDLHANVTQQMVDNAEILVGYDTFPHIDFFQTGEKAARLLISTLRGEIKPTMAMKKIPMIVPAENMQTTHGPMAELMKKAKRWEKEGQVVSVSIFGVQPWLDIQDTGWSTVVVTDNNLPLARNMAHELARSCWELRHRFSVKLVPVKEALRRAVQIEGGPVILSDSADSVSGGAPGDSTAVLRVLVEANVNFPVTLTITDAQAVEKCIGKGVGTEVSLEVGSKIDNIFNKPVQVKGYVKLISDGKYTLKGPTMTGVQVSMGKTVVLIINKNINLVITQFPSFSIDPEQYKSVGIEPKDMKVVVVKSPNTFRAAYQSIAKEIIMLDTPGMCSASLISMPFKNIKRPIYPFDDMRNLEV